MSNRIKSLMYAAVVGLIIVAIFLGFLSSMSNPISWILIAVLFLIPVLYRKNHSGDAIQWKEEYSVGIQVIDDDHKKLISLLNQFISAYDYAMSESYEKDALNNLIDYTKYHFSREEQLMKEHEFPGFEAHKALHVAMFSKVEYFVELYEKQGHNALQEISDFLSKWLINHINGTDKEYSQYLNDRGIR
jgi:hemerythrin